MAWLLLLFGIIEMLKPVMPVCQTITEKGRACPPPRLTLLSQVSLREMQ